MQTAHEAATTQATASRPTTPATSTSTSTSTSTNRTQTTAEKSPSASRDVQPKLPAAALADNQAQATQSLDDAASWDQCFRQLPITGMLKQLAGHCQFQRRDGNHVYFHLSQQQRHFLNQERQQQLLQALRQWSAAALELHIDIIEVEANQHGEQELPDTPLQRQKLRKQQRQLAAQQALDGDKLLQEFLNAFDANIIPGSVESVENEDA